ncbi:MAG: glutamate-5-semialdehyde dehydrogenase, partial [Myxococcales bacterium]|nr:glutamate-5-semialdehyde dehydrogenase [Myxococcales bacterium]
IAQQAKQASYKLASVSSDEKNQALLAIAQALDEHRDFIKVQNALDMQTAVEGQCASSLIDRLRLDDKRIDSMIEGVRTVAELSDPIGKLITSKKLDNGLELKKIRVPLGVIGVIFESRPNVVVDVAALCLKSGNAVILRGGKEAWHSNQALIKAIDAGLNKINFPLFAVQMIPINDRLAVNHLCRFNDYIDVIIPRGGEGLIQAVSDCATVPVIKHYKGVCNIFIDESADIKKALDICHNAKVQRPGVCNAVETILVHQKIAQQFLPKLYENFNEAQVEIRGDEKVLEIIPAKKAQEEDWATEYLDLIVAIKIVNDVEEAISHINCYGSHHSDSIVSENKSHQLRFTKEVDSAAIYVNASTRFTDGACFGLGAEIGISTDKLHARGPMGLNELTTYKWVGIGNGQIRK